MSSGFFTMFISDIFSYSLSFISLSNSSHFRLFSHFLFSLPSFRYFLASNPFFNSLSPHRQTSLSSTLYLEHTMYNIVYPSLRPVSFTAQTSQLLLSTNPLFLTSSLLVSFSLHASTQLFGLSILLPYH